MGKSLTCLTVLLHIEQVLRCSNIAVTKVARLTELIHEALDNDKQARWVVFVGFSCGGCHMILVGVFELMWFLDSPSVIYVRNWGIYGNIHVH